MAMQSSPRKCPKEIRYALCRPSKTCDIDAFSDRLDDNGIYPVWVADMIALLGNWTVGSLDISVI